MEFELKQYQCDCCGCLTDVLDPDQKLPDGWKVIIPGYDKYKHHLDFWVCRCDWDDYFDFRIIADYGIGHVRVSFFPDEIIISDLFVSVDKRGKRYGTALLDYTDELIKKFGEGKQVSISALTDWEKEWYIERGYKIID